jgi:hypothetical protein
MAKSRRIFAVHPGEILKTESRSPLTPNYGYAIERVCQADELPKISKRAAQAGGSK